jgi:hypothetical protein
VRKDGGRCGRAEQAAEEGINVFGNAAEWDVLADIPTTPRRAHPARAPLGGAAAGRDRARANLPYQRRIHRPLDLVGIGLMTAEEAKDLHAMETSGAARA